MMKKFNDKILIFLLYFFLIAGGLWHMLGMFDTLMRFLAGPMLILISVLVAMIIHFDLSEKHRLKFWLWIAIIFIGSIFAEYVGVKTGLLFGDYSYNNVLQPQVGGVPIAIGFAWIGILLSSLGLFIKVLPNIQNKWVLLPVSAFFMVLFDLIMEPAAVYLNYWNWEGLQVPLLNYITWFILGFMFLFLGEKLALLRLIKSPKIYHFYIAQLIYFIMIDIKIIL